MSREEVERVPEGLNMEARGFVLSLPADRSEKHWPEGMSAYELRGLRGFGQSGLIRSRYEHGGVWHALTDAGLAVRAYLKERGA